MNINEYVLKVSGTGSIIEPLEIGKDYKVSLEGTIVSSTESDNDNGTHNVFYKLKTRLIEGLKQNMSNIPIKDKSPLHSKLRARQYIWSQEYGDSEHDYEFFVNKCIQRMDDVMELLLTDNDV